MSEPMFGQVNHGGNRASVSNGLNVLMVAPLPPPTGGIATSTQNILEHVATYGIDVRLVDSAVRWRRPTQTGSGLHLIGGTAQALRLLWQVRRAVEQLEPNVVHICTSGGLGFVRDLLMVKLLRRRHIPSVLHLHMGRLPSILQIPCIESKLARAVFRETSLVALLDEKSQTALTECEPLVHTEKCPNFIDIEGIRDLASDKPGIGSESDIVFVGWVVPTKGVRELIEACGLAGGVRLKLVGPVEQAFADELIAAAQKWNISLELTGPVEKATVYRAIAAARVLALPSHSEGFPYVVLEAMALGKPVLATPVGAIPEILQSGSSRACGRTVSVRDVAGLRDAIVDVITNPVEWQIMGQHGRERVLQCYSDKAVMPHLISIWQRAANVDKSQWGGN